MNELSDISGIGPKTIELMNKLGIFTIDDLINHYPFRYEVIKRSNLNELFDGCKITIDGIVEGQPTVIYINPKLKRIIFRINTGNCIMNVTIYNRIQLMNIIKNTEKITIIGKYDKYKNTIIANDIRLGLLPPIPIIDSIYYTTAGLNRKIFNKYIDSLLLSGYDPSDRIPEYLKDRYKFLSKSEAICEVHSPTSGMFLKRAKQRLKYEELFVYLLKINYLKRKINNSIDSISRNIDLDEIDKFIKRFKYELTIDQKSSVKEIISDLCGNKRMNRLLQGDVGSGKTIVAFIAIYANFLSGYQSALMVPTEILAQQHYKDALELFDSIDIRIVLLTSNTSKKEKNIIYKGLEDGTINFVIGTQSLIQDGISYSNLGLVVTDEQHRFGVNQRDAFKNKGVRPDVLSMSATPIPRTYALTIYGDMDVSSIKTKPVGRKEVITYFKKEKDMDSVLNLMYEELKKGHQIYVIAPSIDGEDSSVESVEDLSVKMNKVFGQVCKIGEIHGKLDVKEKNKIMKEYEDGKINILISTTVIEVGVNVPNASMIVIMDANYFGLSTIHQLRGRVGRSSIQSYCILVAKEYQERLKMLEGCSDGFKISEYDFTNRGEGDLFGIRQSGDTGLILANINRDYELMLRVRDDVLEFLDNNINELEKYPNIKIELDKLDLAN